MEDAGETITGLHQIWTVESPPSVFCNEKDEEDPDKPVKKVSALNDARMILAAIKRCANKKSAEFLDAEDKIKTAMQAAQEVGSCAEKLGRGTELMAMMHKLEDSKAAVAVDPFARFTRAG